MVAMLPCDLVCRISVDQVAHSQQRDFQSLDVGVSWKVTHDNHELDGQCTPWLDVIVNPIKTALVISS